MHQLAINGFNIKYALQAAVNILFIHTKREKLKQINKVFDFLGIKNF